jgi:alpha-galactosidase
MLRIVCCIFLLGALAAIPAGALRDNGLARTPPMGWSSRGFGQSVDDPLVRAIADAVNANGMRQAGYSYINIDDAWQDSQRNGQGDIRPNGRFPDMRALAGYIHSRGLFIGIYSSPSAKTCLGYEGSYGHEEQDARVFAAWSIDFLEYSWCAGDKTHDSETSLRAAYLKMGEELHRAGRPIVYSLGESGKYEVWKWAAQTGANLWRTSGDVETQAEFARPGHWNYPGPLTPSAPPPGKQAHRAAPDDPALRMQMSMWAMLAAPLFVEGDPRSWSTNVLAILTNHEVIGVDQDPAGTPGFRRSASNGLEVWIRHLADGGKAVGWFNHRDTRARFTMTWSDFGADSKSVVRDLWQHRVMDTSKPEFLVDVDKHDVMMVRVYTSQ